MTFEEFTSIIQSTTIELYSSEWDQLETAFKAWEQKQEDRFEIEHDNNGRPTWYIYDRVESTYRGSYDKLITAQEDCNLFNAAWGAKK